MNIKIEYSKDHYRADCLDLGGTPPVGLGRTPELAVTHLFFRLLVEQKGGSGTWIDLLKLDTITVNNETWTWPKSYGR